MELSEVLREGCLLLLVAVPCLVLSQRLKLSSTIAFIGAGLLIGPAGLALVKPGGSLHALTDLALVLVMFTVGVGLHPRDLGPRWGRLLALGAAQVVACGAVLAIVCIPVVHHWEGAVVTGATLAMSSTALGLQTLRERGELRSELGQKALAILVVQDIAVFPLMMLLPVLNPERADTALPPFGVEMVVMPIVSVAAIALASRFLAAPLLRTVIGKGSAAVEGSTIALTVLGAATLADFAGIPPTLGAFVAGISLASSPIHERVESIVRPHGTLLLSLFFVTIGVAINLREVESYWLLLLVLVAAVLILKTVVIYGLSRAFGGSHGLSARLGILLSQGGEFGFTVATVTLALGWASHARMGAVILVIAATLACTPLILRFTPVWRTPAGDPKSPGTASSQ